MKLLVVAHPDDEVIWFNPEVFDRIIVFSAVHDRPGQEPARSMAIREHPLADRIECLQLTQSAYWRFETQLQHHRNNFLQLEKMLVNFAQQFQVTEVFTHNALGEYGHFDHILVHDLVKAVFAYRTGIPVWALPIPNAPWGTRVRSARFIDTNYELFNAIRDVYLKHGVWTFDTSYQPPARQEYHLVC
ncbi:MAG: hypothetical protein FJ170_06560 [Gammaproteobacteria bacterium]|nr:hypothetical protein [Gammaproteobacteria bacterium]